MKLAVIDFETDPFKYGEPVAPFAAGYYDGDSYEQFWGNDCVEQLIDHLREEEPSVIYAHNGGKFDFFFMLDYFDESLKLINGRIASAKILGGQHELRDSYLILPMPLKTHGKKVISYRKMHKQFREKYKQEILSYLRFDCVSLYDWVKSFRDLYGNGLTLAGSAFKQLKKTGYTVQNTYENYDAFFRQFYFGGRVQCFEVGAFYGEHLYVDINSAYPFAMLSKHWHGAKYIECFKLPDGNGSYFARIKAVSRGALPLKAKDGSLFFPSDNIVREYYVSGWEIQAGLDTGTLDIKEIIRVYKPVGTESFSEYVNHFFKIKHDAEIVGDNTMRTFAKLMLNSCYGKFGQDGRNFEDYAITPLGYRPEKESELHPWRPYAITDTQHCIFNRPAPVDNFYNVCTAASITGFVRAYLWRAICSSEGVLYCDTDAIICKKFSGEIGDKIGQWDIEFKPTEIYIAQKKMYALRNNEGDRKIACKGVRLKFDQIKDGVINHKNIVFKKASPAFSLKYGVRFFTREVDFKNYKEKAKKTIDEINV